jgi:hypothetical protein
MKLFIIFICIYPEIIINFATIDKKIKNKMNGKCNFMVTTQKSGELSLFNAFNLVTPFILLLSLSLSLSQAYIISSTRLSFTRA